MRAGIDGQGQYRESARVERGAQTHRVGLMPDLAVVTVAQMRECLADRSVAVLSA